MKNIAVLAFLCLSLACSSAAVNVNVAGSNANADTNANAEPQATPMAGAGESQAAAAEALVADLYKAHDEKGSKRDPFFQTKNRALVDKYFTKALADIIWKDATTTPKGEEGAIGADPLYDAQDTDIKNFAVGHADVKGDTANVPVTFTNFGGKKTINFKLALVNSAWKIDDIVYGGEDGTLRQWFKDTAAAEKTGNFEGTYKVGDTTCTIKPSKMSYELRWAKGSGVEMLFSKDGNAFESEPNKEGKRDKFEFDDGSYSTGTFYRADGKNFPVKRIG
jgi:hypothetical protein